MLASRTSVRASAAASTGRPACLPFRGVNTFARAAPVPRARHLLVKAELKVGSLLSDTPEAYRQLRASDGSSVSLTSYKGKKPVVLFFYPAAGTPGCTKQACGFRDRYEQFVSTGAAVFGISNDEPEKNLEFAKAQNLQYPLLTDSSNILRKVFGIKGDLFGVLPGRQTYVFDKAGKCILSFNDQFNPDKHIGEALAALKTLK